MRVQTEIDALAPGDDWAVEAVERLLAAGARLGCSDVHILCRGDGVLVRGRRQGDLIGLCRVEPHHREMLIARLKILARLPAFVRHEPQDGRIEWNAGAPGDRRMLLRVSFLPTLHGENVVIRFPEPVIDLALDRLGMSPPVLAAVEAMLQRPEGTLLLTGPSSSGKTSTIYAMMSRLYARHGERLNFLTIEDPVERDLGFAGQVQINESHQLTFERALRAALRQDPNVLMIGEIRDLETARTALHAGMTGHLVLSTLHAGRSSLVFSRLLSLGVSRYVVASALNGVLAQRLVRLVCGDCGGSGEAGGNFGGGGAGARTGGGACAACHGTGHAGRTGIFELVRMSEPLREAVLAEASTLRITAEADRARLGSLPEQARELVESGRITRSEFELIFAGMESARSGNSAAVSATPLPSPDRTEGNGRHV